jgi:hypothetical protein
MCDRIDELCEMYVQKQCELHFFNYSIYTKSAFVDQMCLIQTKCLVVYFAETVTDALSDPSFMIEGNNNHNDQWSKQYCGK